jgi:hypothetical protein
MVCIHPSFARELASPVMVLLEGTIAVRSTLEQGLASCSDRPSRSADSKVKVVRRHTGER